MASKVPTQRERSEQAIVVSMTASILASSIRLHQIWSDLVAIEAQLKEEDEVRG